MDLTEALANYDNPWLATLLAALIGSSFAIVVHMLASAGVRRIVRFSPLLQALFRSIRQPTRIVFVLFALQFVWAAAPDDLRLLSAVTRITGLVMIAALTWLAVRAVSAVSASVIALHPANVSDNLEARRIQTQTKVLARTLTFFVVLAGAGAALMTFPNVRQIGTSLLASAGVAGLVAGIAARPVLANLIAGLQIALTQPIRLDDVVIIEGEWGRIEEITATYVVVKLWDERRLVVPLQWVIEHPFQNWTRRESQLLGTVFLWLDYRVPLAPLREELQRVCSSAPEWDGRVALLQVVDTNERAMQIRVLVSSADASKGWDLRCRVREALIDFLQRQVPNGLPRMRAEIERAEKVEHRKRASPPPLRAGRGDSSAIKRPEHAGRHAPPVPKDGAPSTQGRQRAEDDETFAKGA
jgi:small-conductance mechanosensitive channel